MANPVVEYLTFGVLMVANLGLGLYLSFRGKTAVTKTTDEMFLGSRTLRLLPLAVSVLASMISTIGIIGFAAHFYTYGFHFLWTFLTAPLVAIIVSRIVVPVLYELKVTSVFEVSIRRTSNPVKIERVPSVVQ